VRKSRWGIFFLVGLIALGRILPAHAQEFGAFLDELNVQLLDDGRKLKLLNDYRFRDPQNQIWTAPNGWTVDGASIPRPLWSLIGGPLEGPYRNASVIHDYYCDTKTKTWQDTHLAFYNGMRAAGVGEIKAEAMYYAVYKYGPRWNTMRITTCLTLTGPNVRCDVSANRVIASAIAGPTALTDVEEFERKLIATGPIPLSQIRQQADADAASRFSAPLR
jgi:hypothetical protein